MKDCDLRAIPIYARKKRTMPEVTPEDLERWIADNPERVKEALRTVQQHDALLERLGSDYDENGVPYWEQQIHD